MSLGLDAGFERATPLDALTIRAVPPIRHGALVGTAGRAFGSQRHGWLEREVPRIAFVQRDDQFRVPPFIAQLIKAHGIAGFVEASDLDRKTQVVAGLMHREEAEHGIVPTVIGEQNKEREFDGRVERIRREFVIRVPVDPAIVVTIVAPARGGVAVIAFTVAPFVGRFALVVAFAVFTPVGIRPRAEFRAVP